MFDNIQEVKKTKSEDEVNELLQKGWKLINIVPIGFGFQYLLVREG